MPEVKNGKQIYEYFRESSETITGIHKTYMDAMWEQNQKAKSYFDRLVDLYVIAAAVGVRLNLFKPEDKGLDPNEKRTIQLDQLGTKLDVLEPLMRVALIKTDTLCMNMEDKLDNAFRTPEDEVTYKRNMNTFNSYVRGGIEYLYENLVKKIVSPDDEDYGDAKISNIVALINNLNNTDI